MADYLVEDRPANGAQTHVLIIGAGNYPHFSDGSDPTGADDFGMKQLSSPIQSAKEIASWFIQFYDHPYAPLGTVRLLLSENGNDQYDHPVSGDMTVAHATFQNVRDAIRAWKSAGDDDVGNVLILYFSGHGVMDGEKTVLVLEDYGKDDQAPLDGAFDFSQVYRAMAHCKARTQCYFIDACRVAGEDLIDGATIGQGTIIRNEPNASIGLPRAHMPIFYSTLRGAAAFGREGKTSFFAKALISGLNGAASDNTSGSWRVDTSQLLKVIRYALDRAEDRGESLEQINASENMVDLELNIPPPDFKVPVVVGCKNKSENPGTTFSWDNGVQHDRRTPPEEEHWDIELSLDRYDFSAEQNSLSPKTEQRTVRPPFQKVLFP